MTTISGFGIYAPYKNTAEKQIVKEIQDKFLTQCIEDLKKSSSHRIKLLAVPIFCKYSELSEPSQKYLQSKDCSKEQNIKIFYDMEEMSKRIESAFTSGLEKHELYFWGDEGAECEFGLRKEKMTAEEKERSKDTDLTGQPKKIGFPFQGYAFTYTKV